MAALARAVLKGPLTGSITAVDSPRGEFDREPSRTIGMVFAGGLGLAAYHAGVYQGFAETELPLHWLTGSSAGAVTAALIAGNPRADRIGRLQSFWNVAPATAQTPKFGKPNSSRHLFG